MGIEASALLYATAAISAVSTYNQYQAAQNQAEAQQEAQKIQQRASEVEAQRQRIAQVREARIRRAQVLASGATAGLASDTSGIAGGTSSITSQESANIGTINQMQSFGQEASSANQRAMEAHAEGATWQAIGQVSGSIFKDTGGWASIFGGNTFQKAQK